MAGGARAVHGQRRSVAPGRRALALGKQAYDLAERAIAANPNDVAGHYWAALSIGSYAEGMGVMRALANGIEGKFKRPLERATALDVRYDHGNIPVVWAAYYLELPWPKRDRARAARELRARAADQPGEPARQAVPGAHRHRRGSARGRQGAAGGDRGRPRQSLRPARRTAREEGSGRAGAQAALKNKADEGTLGGGASSMAARNSRQAAARPAVREQRAAVAPALRQLRVREGQREADVGQHVVDAHGGPARLPRHARATSARPAVITTP